jgi:hypothetical protein
MMEPEDEKYRKILAMLKASRPALKSPDEIGDYVVGKISAMDKHDRGFSGLIDFLFRWTYIGWVRRSLVTAAAALALIFIVQQGIILRELNQISRQIESGSRENPPSGSSYLERSMVLLRFPDLRQRVGKKAFPDRKVDELLKSIDDLKLQYRDIQEVIEQDPELKKLIEKKLSEIDDTKIKL